MQFCKNCPNGIFLVLLGLSCFLVEYIPPNFVVCFHLRPHCFAEAFVDDSWNMVSQFFGISSDLFLILKYGFHSGFCFILLSFHVLLAIFFEIKIVSMAFCLVV